MRKTLLVLATLAMPGVAQAHDLGTTLSVSDGLLHPLTGMDHLGAAIAIGVLAARRSGLGALQLPISFTLALVAGFMSVASTSVLPFAEAGVIATALLLLGFAALRVERTGLLLAATIPAGLLHGHVHGTGLSMGYEGSYLLGLIASTAVIQAVAFLVARRIGDSESRHRAAVPLVGRR